MKQAAGVMRSRCGIFAVLGIMVALVLATTGVLLGRPVAANAADDGTQIVTTGTTEWQYLDDNTVPVDGWKTSAAVASGKWKTGKGSFGAKKGAIASLGGGCTPQVLLSQYINGQDGDDIPAYYFRTTFDVQDLAAVKAITGEVLYDDSAIVAINGHVIGEFDNYVCDKDGKKVSPETPVYGTTEYGGSNASEPKTGTINFTDIASLGLKDKGNVLSVELHNGRPRSSDVYLDVKSLAFSTGAAQADIKDVSFEVGSNEAQRNFNWLGTSADKSYAEVAAKPAGYKEGDAFPEASAKKVKATQAAAQRAGYRSNKATVTGLSAGTYLYRVGNDAKWSDTVEFTVADQGKDVSFNFLFAGDPQIGAGNGNVTDNEQGWANTLDRALAQLGGADFLVSAGDQINDRGNEDQYDAYYGPEALKSLASSVTVGNHDNGSTRYTDYNNMPNVSDLGSTADKTGIGSGDYWYTYNGVLFMNLNSNNRTTSEHKEFMKQAIAANPDATWKIVVFHHSTFSLANHYSDSDIIQRRSELPPVFSELGIDAVLMGHDHYFTRTYMMDGETPVVPDGHDISKGQSAPTEAVNPKKGQVVYLTANSASGSKYYEMNGDITANGLPGYVAVQDQSRRQSITNVTVTKDSLTLDTYYTNDEKLEKMDSFTIKRTSAPTITLPGKDGALEVKVGQKFDPMDGVKAVDYTGKTDLTDLVNVEVLDVDGKPVRYVDTSKEGVYAIKYTVEDEFGMSATAELKVTVVKDASNGNNGNQGNGGNSGNNNGNQGGNGNNSGNTGNGSNSGGQAGSSGVAEGDNGSKTSKTPAKTGKALPQTGDTFVPAVAGGIAIAGAALIGCAVYMTRRKHNRL